ncbi:uncharacterized protein K02A2.6-like [Anopheles stephensi]|uniref:uncharacterized protein K02A2.6-like n=1 Tax=Anopheles stephensi TaxID=30069 RepID=UPI001658A326|nr:uncharacterized protein K02A2.6-like [Anopheles stephensi]
MVNQELRNFHGRSESLSTVNGCLLFGERLVATKREILTAVKGHPGMEKLKALARSYVYWPGIDREIEEKVRRCQRCRAVAKSPALSKPIPWPEVAAPWQRVHVDFAGPLDGMYYLLVIDTFTKSPEIVATTTMTAKTTIRILREIFSRFGMPNVLVSDNGTQFTSTEFELFCTINGIEHLRTAPFHPQSNGQAERFVDTFKRALRKMEGEAGSVQEAVDIFLMTYRSTPHKLLERNQSPAELMLGRRLRTCMELLRPTMNVSSGVKVGEPLRKYERNDLVYAKQYYRNKWKWVAGTVRKRLGSVM